MTYFHREWKHQTIPVMPHHLLNNKSAVIWGGKISIGYRSAYKVKSMAQDYWHNGTMAQWQQQNLHYRDLKYKSKS